MAMENKSNYEITTVDPKYKSAEEGGELVPEKQWIGTYSEDVVHCVGVDVSGAFFVEARLMSFSISASASLDIVLGLNVDVFFGGKVECFGGINIEFCESVKFEHENFRTKVAGSLTSIGIGATSTQAADIGTFGNTSRTAATKVSSAGKKLESAATSAELDAAKRTLTATADDSILAAETNVGAEKRILSGMVTEAGAVRTEIADKKTEVNGAATQLKAALNTVAGRERADIALHNRLADAASALAAQTTLGSV